MSKFFANWSRKIAGVAVVVITLIGGAAAWKMLHIPTPPALAEWSQFLKELAWTYAIPLGFSATKSVASMLAEAKKNGNGSAKQ